MSGAAHLESALQRHAEHRHIADKVQYLMADKFIGKAAKTAAQNKVFNFFIAFIT